MSEDTQKENEPEVEEEVTSSETPAEEAAEETVEVAAEAAEEKAPEAVASKEEKPSADAESATKDEEASDSDEKSTEEEEEKSDKLRKAEEILRAQEGPGSRRDDSENLFEKVVHINRCAKVVKGGRRFSFSALVVSGDREGNVGLGFGKAQEVSECIKKASEASKKSMVSVKITNNTIPHPVVGEHGGGRVLLRPASPGTGLIAGGGVRAVVEAAGIKDVLAKSMGSNNHANVVKATLDALEQLRTKEEIYALRGKRSPEKKAL